MPKSTSRNLPTFDEVTEAFCYDPITGYFTRKHDRGHFKKGTRIGAYNMQGYEKIYFKGRLQNAARLAWLYMTGEWPECEIDHKNRNPSDNRWANLRLATTAQNGANREQPRKAIYRGVKIVDGVAFSASICVNNKNIHLGTYNTAEKAALRYDQAAKKHHGEFAIFNFPNSVHRDWILV